MRTAVNGPDKAPRAYDASGRRARAAESRRAVLACARSLFFAPGFASTTVAEIARAAGVSAEFVYKNFGSKAGLVRAIWDQSLLGSGGVPAEQRSDAAQAEATDPGALMEQFGRFVAEISPIGSPVALLIRDAAASGDADMAALQQEVDAARYERMLHNARRVIARGLLRPGLSEAEAADVFFMTTSAELYETLVLKRGWTPEHFGRFVAATLKANLL
ncbi:TetR/AcrR family transcriptional regulator [Sinomonas sp. P10A9]|uniref:TetR/AcrR family transcriptional regulator n=1 Tax=Sinomonas puerhi TaxID=3238584 RepID=A0AB39L1X2_9MICC